MTITVRFCTSDRHYDICFVQSSIRRFYNGRCWYQRCYYLHSDWLYLDLFKPLAKAPCQAFAARMDFVIINLLEVWFSQPSTESIQWLYTCTRQVFRRRHLPSERKPWHHVRCFECFVSDASVIDVHTCDTRQSAQKCLRRLPPYPTLRLWIQHISWHTKLVSKLIPRYL